MLAACNPRTKPSAYAQEAAEQQDVSTLTSEPLETAFTLVVTFGAMSVVNDSTFTGTITASADQYNEGYLPTGITIGMKVLDGVGRRYRISAVNSANLSTADLNFVELQDENQGPSGAGIIHAAYTNYDLIALAPVNSIGISPLTMARALLHNMRVIDTGGGVSGGEAAFNGWDKNVSDDFDGAYSSLTGVPTDWTGTFDGQEGTYYLNYNNLSNTPSIPTISDLAYGIDWDANTDGASKNVIYDKIESINDHASVTLAGTYDYITLSGQEITRGQIDLTTDVTGVLPQVNFNVTGNWTGTFDGLEGASLLTTSSIDDTAYGAGWNGVTGVAPSKNAVYDKIETLDNVTLAGTPDYITIVGQEITRGLIDLTTDVTGVLPDGDFTKTGNWTGTFDGQEGSYYLNYNNLSNKPSIPTVSNVGYSLIWNNDGDATSKNTIWDASFLTHYRGTYNVNTGTTTLSLDFQYYDRVAARVDMTNASTSSTITVSFSNAADGSIYTIWFDDVDASGHNLNFPTNVHNLNNTDLDGGSTLTIDAGYRITCQYYLAENVYICQ